MKLDDRDTENLKQDFRSCGLFLLKRQAAYSHLSKHRFAEDTPVKELVSKSFIARLKQKSNKIMKKLPFQTYNYM